jgi:hypothetical protein
VVELPLWEPQRRRSFLGGSELQIESLVSCLFESSSPISLTLEASFVLIYILVVFLSISLVVGGS